MTDLEIIEKLTELANQWSDGHFTICRFTTNWRVAFDTPDSRCDVCRMYEGKTLEEAARAAIEAGKPADLWIDACECHGDAIKDDEKIFALYVAKVEGSA